MQNYSPVNALNEQLNRASQNKLTGPLEVKSGEDKKWQIYFCVGQMTWISGEWHQVRRLYRQLRSHCPKLSPRSLSLREGDEFCSWDFQVLQALKERGVLTEEQVCWIVESIAMEVLFDMIFAGLKSELNFFIDIQDTLSILKVQSFRLDANSTLPLVSMQVDAWIRAGLGSISPNDAPKLKNSTALEQQGNETYKKLATKINGHRTIRDLATGFKIDTVRFTRVLLPYIKKGWIEVREVPDIPYPSEAKKTPTALPTSSDTPLIVCIDDSLQTIKMMEPIVRTAGYRFLAIQDSIHALLTLIEVKPNLIFLDLVMPVASGYEICTQLRRIPQFDRTPILILTANKGMVNRLRASTVKANGFLAKPVQPNKVLMAIRKFLEKK
jgi:two-component system, chemotaxis family, response regulator PixG